MEGEAPTSRTRGKAVEFDSCRFVVIRGLKPRRTNVDQKLISVFSTREINFDHPF